MPSLDHYTVLEWIGKTGLRHHPGDNRKREGRGGQGERPLHRRRAGAVALACDLIYGEREDQVRRHRDNHGDTPGLGRHGAPGALPAHFSEAGRSCCRAGAMATHPDEFYDMGLLTRVYQSRRFDAESRRDGSCAVRQPGRLAAYGEGGAQQVVRRHGARTRPWRSSVLRDRLVIRERTRGPSCAPPLWPRSRR